MIIEISSQFGNKIMGDLCEIEDNVEIETTIMQIIENEVKTSL